MYQFSCDFYNNLQKLKENDFEFFFELLPKLQITKFVKWIIVQHQKA